MAKKENIDTQSTDSKKILMPWEQEQWRVDENQYSGEHYLRDFNVQGGPYERAYQLNLCHKYNNDSHYKQFHCCTFVFRNSKTKAGAIITAMLPESIAYSFGGVYEQPLKINGSTLFNAVAQAGTNGKLSSSFTASNAKIWTNTQPLSFNLSIPVFDDGGTNTQINLMEALKLLGDVALPEVSDIGTFTSTPGPDLLQAVFTSQDNQKIKGSETANAVANLTNDKTTGIMSAIDGKNKKYDRITVQIGGMLLVDWCIIESVNVNYPNTKAMIAHDYSEVPGYTGTNMKKHILPQMATLTIKLSTVTGLTRTNFDRMLKLMEGKVNTQTNNDIEQAAKQKDNEKSRINNALSLVKEAAKEKILLGINGTTISSSEMDSPGFQLPGIK